MSADGIEIRRLAQEDPADAILYRGIRLEALQANPEAFGSTFEVENAKPPKRDTRVAQCPQLVGDGL
jgi:hypothetical protein